MTARSTANSFTSEQQAAADRLAETVEAIEAAEAEHLKALSEAYRQGLMSTTLAHLLGINERTARKRLRAAGVELTGRGKR